jgi:acetylornithine deacetylase/succinyl-diaminopimelate desuccinylase-like protein
MNYAPIVGIQDESGYFYHDQYNALLSMNPIGRLKEEMGETMRTIVKIQGVYAGSTPGGFHPEPHAILAVQVLPGRSAQDVVQQINKLVQEDIAVEVLNEIPGVQVKTPHPFFHHLKESVKKAQSDAIVTQYGAFAGPEPHALATLDIPTYGFNPIKLPPGFNYQGRAGNVDESAPIEGIQEGFKLYTEAVLNWCYTSH